MAISSASKKKLAIWAVALALGGGTLTASAGACGWNKGYGFRDSAYPAAAGYGFRGYGWRGAGWRGAGCGLATRRCGLETWRLGLARWRGPCGLERWISPLKSISKWRTEQILSATFFNMRAAVDRCLPIFVN